MIGQTFTIATTDTAMGLTIVSVDERDASQFSVNLTGALDPYLEQGTYRFEQEGTEPFDMFIVPLGPDEASGLMRYEAAFA